MRYDQNIHSSVHEIRLANGDMVYVAGFDSVREVYQTMTRIDTEDEDLVFTFRTPAEAIRFSTGYDDMGERALLLAPAGIVSIEDISGKLDYPS